MTVEIRRGNARFVERSEGRITHHSFSFGEHYDAARLGLGPMVCHDDHLLGSGRGFAPHAHSGLEIVTWVVSGALRHVDSSGTTTDVGAGSVAVLSTGAGVEHSEHATESGPCRFIQMWLRADSTGVPSYAVRRVDGPGTQPAAEIDGSKLYVVRVAAGETATLPAAPLLHAFVVSGALTRSSLAQPLSAGDAFVATDHDNLTVQAGVPTEILVWTFS